MNQVVVDVPKETRTKLKKATKNKGGLKKMVDNTDLSKTAIYNARDRGLCLETSLEKIEAYLDQINTPQHEKNHA